MTNRDRFSKIADFLVQSLSIIIFFISVGILFVVMFITLPDDVDLLDMIQQPENISLVFITIVLNIQVKLLGGNLITNKYHQSNEYQFAEKVDGKTTGELLKNQHRFIAFNANRTINNKKAAQHEYLSNYGYNTIEEVRADMANIKPTKQAYKLAKKKNKYAKETYELGDKYRRYKKAPRILRRYRKVRYISTIIHRTFWNYITQSAFKKGKRLLISYRPASKTGTIIQTILMAGVTSMLAIQTFRFGYDPEKLPVFMAMLGTIGLNFLTAIVLTLIRLKEIPAFVKNKFRELNEFRETIGLSEAPYLEDAAKELAQQIAAEIQSDKDRARAKRERKAAKMTEDTKLALAKEATKKLELEIRKTEANNKREELAQNRKEGKALKLVTQAFTKGE
jgi:hypothetical protein